MSSAALEPVLNSEGLDEAVERRAELRALLGADRMRRGRRQVYADLKDDVAADCEDVRYKTVA